MLPTNAKYLKPNDRPKTLHKCAGCGEPFSRQQLMAFGDALVCVTCEEDYIRRKMRDGAGNPLTARPQVKPPPRLKRSER